MVSVSVVEKGNVENVLGTFSGKLHDWKVDVLFDKASQVGKKAGHVLLVAAKVAALATSMFSLFVIAPVLGVACYVVPPALAAGALAYSFCGQPMLAALWGGGAGLSYVGLKTASLASLAFSIVTTPLILGEDLDEFCDKISENADRLQKKA